MDPPPKADLFGVKISLTDYDEATRVIVSAGRARRSLAVTALATHGLVEGVRDPAFRDVLNAIDMVTPDGQPVRWAMNLLHRADLPDRVCGPDLLWKVCATAAKEGIGVYIFGSTDATCARLETTLRERLTAIRIVGVQPDRFRDATPDEDALDVRRINESGAGIVLVGRGCPRQERWVVDHRGRVNAAMLAVGAAFDFAAGSLCRAPTWMQCSGLEWLHRLAQEPRRLGRRYTVTNSLFMILLMRELMRMTWRDSATSAVAVPHSWKVE